MKLYKSYMFRDKDPVIDKVRTAIADSGETYAHIQRRSGVTAATLRNWFHGPTKRPQFATVQAVLRSIGKTLTVVDMEKKDAKSKSYSRQKKRPSEVPSKNGTDSSERLPPVAGQQEQKF